MNLFDYWFEKISFQGSPVLRAKRSRVASIMKGIRKEDAVRRSDTNTFLSPFLKHELSRISPQEANEAVRAIKRDRVLPKDRAANRNILNDLKLAINDPSAKQPVKMSKRSRLASVIKGVRKEERRDLDLTEARMLFSKKQEGLADFKRKRIAEYMPQQNAQNRQLINSLKSSLGSGE